MKGKVKNNKLFVVQTTEQEIDSEDLTSEYKMLCDTEQDLLDRIAPITERKKEIRDLLEGAMKDTKDENIKSHVVNKLNSVEPTKGKPTVETPFKGKGNKNK